jgi:cyclophilin family peptidyl-prolyl cis-trans isomerase
MTAHPARAMTGGTLDTAMKKALLDQLASQIDLEARAAVVGAVAAFGIVEAKDALVSLCGGASRSLREHAERALAKLMPAGAPRCRGGGPLAAPVELERRAGKVRLTLKTDAGELRLRLDGALAPVAVTRARDLGAGDYFDGLVVHRLVPGFVAQFGSPSGDGFGGVKGLPALPCETSPVPFGERSVGVALAGRDTGSSQLFVTFAPTPHLDGEYAWLGTAEGPWEALVEGDVIHDVIVEE